MPRGIAQLVARVIWDHQVVCSSHTTPTLCDYAYVLSFLIGCRHQLKTALCDYDVVATYGLAKAGSRVQIPLVAPNGLVGKWLIRLTVYQKIVGSSPIEIARRIGAEGFRSALPLSGEVSGGD